jgi:PAS domain S-box-containing protein
LDPDGDIATWNAGAQRLKGYTAGEVLGKNISIYYPKDDVEKGKPQQLLREATANGSVTTQGWRLRKDGSQFWAEVSLTALFEPDGRVKGFAKIIRDITDLRESRLALEAKQTELRAVLESTPDAVLMVNHAGDILFANSSTEAMFGYSHHELIGKKEEILVPRSHKRHHAQHREAYAKAPHARPMAAGLELYGLKKDGSEFAVEISLGPVGGDGEPRIVASVRDVTEHRRLERELQNRKIQELAQVLIRELDGRIVQWNAGMKRMYGFSRGEAVGAISHELLRTTFPAALGTIEADLLRTGYWEGELVHRRKDGSRIYVNSYWVLHCDKDGKPRLILESSTDITALKEAEAQTRLLNRELEHQNADLTLAKALIEAQTQKIAVAAKMSALGEMAGGMAHEINNPMGIIHARASDLMEFAEERDAVPSRVVIETMEKIRNTASRVTKITQGLRKFARESHNDPVTQVFLKDIIDDTLSFCTQRLKQSAVELRLAPIQASLEVSCRPTEISQVLLNLLNNSLDAVQTLPEKWVELSAQDTGSELEISVMDSGSGIPENVRERMGQPFFTTKEIGRGTGLGLSISRGIVEAHGGHLTLDTSSKHTRFVVTLPKSHLVHAETVSAGPHDQHNLRALSG